MAVNTSGTGATFRERMNWVSLVSLVGVYGVLIVEVAEAPTDPVRTAQLFIIAILIQGAVAVGGAIVVALTSSEEPDDERVKAILRRRARYSSPLMTIVTAVAVFATVAQQIVGGVDAPPLGLLLEPLMIAHLLFFGLALSELIRGLTLAYDYRRT